MKKFEAIFDGLHYRSRNRQDWAVGANLAAGMDEVVGEPLVAVGTRAAGKLAAVLTGLPKERMMLARQ